MLDNWPRYATLCFEDLTFFVGREGTPSAAITRVDPIFLEYGFDTPDNSSSQSIKLTQSSLDA
jgi:hypothetical protein